MIVMIDNYDSFTYNLVQYLRELGANVKPVRNDVINIDEIESWQPAGIVISPGPGRPESAGISLEVVRQFSGRLPILGVCLGHQTIAQAFGAKIVPAEKLMHGKTSMIINNGKKIYNGINKPFKAMRYHSLAVSRDTLPECFSITSETEDDGEIMGIRHKTHPTEGIQFHPESIMTPEGRNLLGNYLKETYS
ncbi:MAG: aminodeoxychorismate/anthranilate synthase component II [Desulfobacterales bacterium]|jgi:anthranilate synthase/aminodeoxychorismate synthase-like glutamine amidotransferase|nr:aminodeoxychorismate/anthranilate synthase component II [Desulfobacteraceae bacterium]MBT4365616.1 aminodeoxychorismate/anthranilate synthase component II [Desulfobacteraceae bacterium]MBT7086511.1 aminodeoxychorismate/anthranilate synthase component II [Desulfobacterales bacterium]MBT7696704.1 aminodeoxychorismate/anthranilate synthase component II [Desulfobacterales bacterium]